MESRKLILHIGYSKCGSSTIQETLSGNYAQLLREDILFPRVLSESPSWLRFFWESNLPVTYSEQRVRDKFTDFLNKLKKEVDDTQASTIILSDEGLISLGSPDVRALKEFLADFFKGYEVEVVCIVREPISFFTSRCQQFISDRYFDDEAIESFIEGRSIENGEVRSDCHAMNPEFFFSQNIGNYRECFNHVTVLKFETAVRDSGGLTHYFLKSIGVDKKIKDVRLNESRSNQAIEVISYINSKMPFNASSGLWKYRRYGDLRFFYDLKGPKYSLPEHLKWRLADKIESEVEWLSENYGIAYHGESVLNNSSQKVVWDKTFYEESVEMFPVLPLHLKILFKCFVFEKTEDPSFSQDEGFLLTSKWIKKKYPLLCACNDSFAFILMKVFADLQGSIIKTKMCFRPFLYRVSAKNKGPRP